MGELPIDPINTSSTRLYYTYTTNGSQYELTTAAMESQKYQLGGSNDVIGPDGGPLATVYEKGTAYGLEPLDYGDPTLVVYWSLNEGTGTVAYDYSGNNATGNWSGTQTGTNGYYSAGKGKGYSWAGAFDGSSTYVGTLPISMQANAPVAISAWVLLKPGAGPYPMIACSNSNILFGVQTGSAGNHGFDLYLAGLEAGQTTAPATNTWYYVVGEYNGSVASLYVNANLVQTSGAGSSPGSANWRIGYGTCLGNSFWDGLIDDVRIYNRALSAAQIAAMYNSGK